MAPRRLVARHGPGSTLDKHVEALRADVGQSVAHHDLDLENRVSLHDV